MTQDGWYEEVRLKVFVMFDFFDRMTVKGGS
jgi:hypothetical protein